MSRPPLHVRVVPHSGFDVSCPDPIVLRSRTLRAVLPVTRETKELPSLDDVLFRGSQINPEWRGQLLEFLGNQAQGGRVQYLVPGSPLAGDATVQQLLAAEAAGTISVSAEQTAGELVLARALANYPEPRVFIDSLTLLEADALDPFAGGSLPISANQTTILTNVHVPAVAGVWRALARRVGPDVGLSRISLDGIGIEEIGTVDQLRDGPGVLDGYLIIPAATGDRFYRSPDDLQRLVARLRAPGGCPWDREQTNRSLTRTLVEESYELLEAIESGDVEDMREEMGDFILQAYLQCQIAEERAEFTLEDVLDTLIQKLIRRHPHVFAMSTADDSTTVVRNWDEIKRAERAEKTGSNNGGPLGNVPVSMPALARAQTLLKRARRSDRDLDDIDRHRDVSTGLASSDVSAPEMLNLILDVIERAAVAGIDLEELLREWTRAFERSVASATDADLNN